MTFSCEDADRLVDALDQVLEEVSSGGGADESAARARKRKISDASFSEDASNYEGMD